MEQSKPTTTLEKSLIKRLDDRYIKSTLRKLTIAKPGSIDFSSNDFLSLSTSSALRQAFIQELSDNPEFPLGSGGSRLLDGNSQYALDLEESISKFHGARAGLLWNSGFDANAGVFACIPQPGDIILYDELIHASVHDGMKVSRASRKIPFKHNSVEHLKKIVQALKDGDVLVGKGPKNVFVAVESIYSMDGDLCPLTELVDAVEEVLPYGNGHIIVDEAHATGVLGPRGRGLVSALGLEERIFMRLHTFGKGVGASGAITLSSPLVRSYLINYARPLIYTTFMPFINLAAIKASYSLLQSGATEPVSSDHVDGFIQSCQLTMSTARCSSPKTDISPPHAITASAQALYAYSSHERNALRRRIMSGVTHLCTTVGAPAFSCGTLPGGWLRCSCCCTTHCSDATCESMPARR